MADLSQAIQELRWTVENDFAGRRTSWWEAEQGRHDMRRLRSCIAGVRVLERQQKWLDG